MTAKYLAAHTPPGFEPPFVNLSLDGGEVVITLRENAVIRDGHRTCGDVISAHFAPGDIEKLLEGALANLRAATLADAA